MKTIDEMTIMSREDSEDLTRKMKAFSDCIESACRKDTMKIDRLFPDIPPFINLEIPGANRACQGLKEATDRLKSATSEASKVFNGKHLKRLKLLKQYNWGWMEEVMVRYRAACAHPDDPKSKLWLELSDWTPQRVHKHLNVLPDPRRKKVGRPPKTRTEKYERLYRAVFQMMKSGMSLDEAAKAAVIGSKQKCGHENTLKYLKKMLRNEVTLS